MSQQLTFDLNVDNQAAISSINTFFDAFDAGVKNAGQMLDKQFGDKTKVIGIKIEGGKAVASEIENVNSIGGKLSKTAKVINGEFGKTPGEVKRSIAVLREAINGTKKYADGTKKVTEDWKLLVTKLKEAQDVAKTLRISPKFEKSITGANVAAGLALDAIRAMGRAVMAFVNQAVEMEVLMIQLEGFTGGIEEAQEAFEEFVNIAKKTPLNVQQVAEASRTMMGFGIDTAESIKRVEQLAIVAASTAGDVKMMARNLGQVSANQKAYTRDLMQFANQGIPIYQELGKVMGKSTEQVRQLATEGAIGFTEVAAALDEMTKKGSAYERIADKMSRTFQSRLEEIASSAATTSAKFISAIQNMDAALGGPIEKSFAAVATMIDKIGDSFGFLAKHARTLAPLIAAIATAITAAMAIAFLQNLGPVLMGLAALAGKYWAIVTATKAWAAAQMIVAALTGNFAAIALAAGVAAGGMYLYNQNTKQATTSQADLNAAMNEQKEGLLENAKAQDLLVFKTKELSGEQRKQVKAQKAAFTAAQQGYKGAQAEMQRALQFLQDEAEAKKQIHKDTLENLKEELEAIKDKESQALDAEKIRHEANKKAIDDELSKIREKYDLLLGKLDEESEYSKRLTQIKRQELQAKLAQQGLTEKETLEIKEQLLQMDKSVERKRLLALRAKEIAEKEKEATKETERHNDAKDRIIKKYDKQKKAVEATMKEEAEAIDKIDKEYKRQADKVDEYKRDELRAIYRNRDAAIASIDAQIVKANNLKAALQQAYQKAQDIQNLSGGAPNAFTGGPVSGGELRTVNEFGKEAFLSASGKLSMINAPAWGEWRAPTSGTIIPAHLTNQLDVPRGGINLNTAASMNASKAGRVSRTVSSVSGGDNITNNVTIQSANPTQTASDVMVQLAKLKRLRYN